MKLGFALIKATEGLSFVDWQYGRNWRNAKKAGMPRGAYHYFIPTLSGKQQAEHFIRTVQLEKGDLPPVLDIEEIRGAKPDDLAKGRWISSVRWNHTTECARSSTPMSISTNATWAGNLMRTRFGWHTISNGTALASTGTGPSGNTPSGEVLKR